MMADGYGPRLWPILCILLQLLISSSPTISNGLNQPLQLHPLSERLTTLLTRAKRQAYQVYLGGEASVSVDQGAGDSGPWSEWTTERECSRTCGGGVYVEKRECAETCTGPQIRYISCNVQPCPEDAKDFRAEQCTAHNDDAVGGKYFKWVPFSGNSINKCELTCRPEEGSNFYYKFAEKVVDGTKCDPYGDDICVDGICLPVGCDGKLGSVAKKDKCGVCNGDGSQCKTMEGLFDERSLARGYHDIISLPVGATAIHVEEVRPTGNVFAIKNATGQWLLNGDYQIQVLDKNIMAGGTAFKYEKGESGTEKLTANGPLQEAITIALLLQRVSTKNSPVKYEFSVPLEKDVKFLYKPGEWSSCSVTCGKGIRTRALYCMDVGSQSRVDDSVCEEQNATKPEFERSCSTVDCQPEWFTGDWEPCSATCGNQGIQFRVVYCHRVFADGRRMTVPDANCTGGDGAELPRPELNQPCSRWSCPEWQAGPWSACSSQCGDARQFRSVTCRSAKEGEEGRLLAAEACGDQQQPEADRDCNLGPCEGLRFHTTDWDLCQNCNDTEERRNVSCQDKNGRLYPLEKCLGNETKQIPEETRPCASSAPCIYEWHTSQWSKCSTECGHGHKSRKVFCAINELGQTKRVDQSLCGAEEKPEAEEECVNEEKCTGTYFTGPWTECSASCDGGKQSRSVVCLNYDRKPVPEWCDEKERPAESQDCNAEPCPKCSDSEFGCCPDGETFASGPFLAGCSNCSQAEFGCCSDNMTESQGAQGQGCPDFVEPSPKSDAGLEGEAAPTEGEEGSGEEPMMEEKPAAELCQVENAETGEKLTLPCTTIAPPSASPSMEQLEEATTTEEPNATKHCSKTEFGCCPDWYTPAEGPQQAGCPQFVLGTCNGTKFGCCLDGVTLARGPDFEGCGESTCAGSLYGCCRDRRTIAFGPHYAGCERSSFPCELSQFGCCSDGTTAALGANGTGCGANCLLTKFGCCPDGKTQSRGPNNEGCGCEFAQYGCCPNGKDAAKGPGFYGCPDSCAQSKFGCCPDGKTSARGPNKEGCPCQYTRWGCCDDGETTALGPLNEGCDDCRYAKYGCCQDGVNKAFGPDYAGCPTTTQAPYIVAGTVSPSTIVACSLPQDQGQVCAPGYKLVWFYDTTEGRCSQFWFGGCAGNENRFNSKEQCEQICVEPPGIGRCFLPKVEGPQRCNQLAARYWYDYMSKQCTAFWHRGCLGNANNFGSWEECQNYCAMADASQVRVDYSSSRVPQPHQQSMQIPQQPPQSQQVAAMMPPPPMPIPDEMKTREVCNLRPDIGKCEGHFESWYYELATGQCERFTYSGCGGNANRFNSQEECQTLCLRRHDYPPPPAVRLGASPSAGVSAFGPQAQEMTSLTIGSLGKAHLAGICEASKDTGTCKQFSTKWFFNKVDGTCNRFHYGGCEGNANRFDTEQECKNTCGDYRDVCLLPKVIGPCAGKTERFYFDFHSRQCLPFQYSGCLGNNNNFRSIEDCHARCQQQPSA